MSQPRTFHHLPARIESPSIPLHDGMRIARDWEAFAVGETGSDHTAVIRWPEIDCSLNPVRLRLTIACDMREAKCFALSLADSGRELEKWEIRFGTVFQPHEFLLSPDLAMAVQREGLRLRMIQGEKPLWFFSKGPPHGEPGVRPLLPHLLTSCEGEPRSHFFERFLSMASLQPFGWLEGCVLDGLLALAPLLGEARVRAVIAAHLGQFLDAGGGLHYEDPRGKPADGRIYGIEGGLPCAVVAKIDPGHALLRVAENFFAGARDAEGCLQDNVMTSAEGCYTVAYPMAVLAELDGREALRQDALHQLLIREQRLFTEQGIHLRFIRRDDGIRRTFLNWSRGVAWYLLGFARCLETWGPQHRHPEAVTAFRRAAEFALQHQRPDGLWGCFLDAPEQPADTAGSSGIAAALALGAGMGVLPPETRQAAHRALEALWKHLTPDGFLGGASQGNKGGEDLQRGNYRVISQMGMGLLAQLVAALPDTPNSEIQKF